MIEIIHGKGTIEKELPAMFRQYIRFGINMAEMPIIVYPTLHYQNGGVLINENAESEVPNLYVAGEASGGVHGRNRLMGNSLLDIIVFGRRAGKNAAEKAKTASGTQTETLGNYQVVNELLENPARTGITGVPSPKAFFPGTQAQEAINKYNQIKSILSLENRQKLKGSGAISDFEAITLEKASSSLGRNLSNEAFDRELKKIRGVFATAAGLSTPVKIIDPKTKKTIDEGSLKRDEINSAISQGFTVEYQ